ncbi:MAG: adenine phosphoribosyltransferase [Acidobacteria bacterium]|nr:adenine phosphoribosyltransferase [Acidobacteriota bacterium]
MPDDLKRYIREIPDFPAPGVLFRDITPLLAEPAALRAALDALAGWAAARRPTVIAAIESRGFVFGAPLALRLDVGFVPIRKPGKLPWEKLEESYVLEYGHGRIEMHRDAIGADQRVLVIDDLLATGGTASAAVRLARRCGGEVVGALFLIELTALKGRALLDGTEVHSIIQY